MRQSKRIARIFTAIALLHALPAVANQESPAPILQLRTLDQRLASAGYRLATANQALCENRQWHPGFLIHDLSQYPREGRPEAIEAFGLGDGPAVLALVAEGPAARAGLELDDVLVAADGVPLPRASASAHDSFEPTERIIDALEEAFADGRAELQVQRGGQSRIVRVAAEQGCASRFQVIPSPRRDAKADGRYVQLTSALVEYARDDDELAALVAHELAHNILRHRARLNAAGVARGLRRYFGRNARLFQETETEADRLAIHLVDRAGFDPRAAVRLWTRQSGDSSGIRRGTHPSWLTRIAALESEIESIVSAKARGEEPRPPHLEERLGREAR